MKRYIKQAISIVLCVAVCVTTFAIPAYATFSDGVNYVVKDFWNWITFDWDDVHGGVSFFSGLWDAINAPTDEEIQNAYNDYVNDIQTNYGTTVLNGATYKWDDFEITAYASLVNDSVLSDQLSISYHYGLNDGQEIDVFSQDAYIVPVTGKYRIKYNPVYVNAAQNVGTYSIYYPRIYLSSTKPNKAFYAIANIAKGTYTSAVGDNPYTGYFDVNLTKGNTVYFCLTTLGILNQTSTINSACPTIELVDPAFDTAEITIDNRMTVIIPQIFNFNTTNTEYQYHIGTVENNAVTNVYDTNIFNETTNVFSLPGDTPTTYNITDWTYDYSTRTYVCVDSDSNVYIVQYGDDAVHVTVPDGSGGTTSYTYYYIYQEPVPSPGNTDDTTTFPGTSSDNYNDDPNTTGGFWSTIWKAFKDGLADLIAGIVKDLFKGLKAIISGILNVFSGLVTGFFDAVNGFFNSFSETGVFQFWNGTVTDLS